jgi:hypothetical protein
MCAEISACSGRISKTSPIYIVADAASNVSRASKRGSNDVLVGARLAKNATPDPLVVSPLDAQAYNRYSYVHTARSCNREKWDK